MKTLRISDENIIFVRELSSLPVGIFLSCSLEKIHLSQKHLAILYLCLFKANKYLVMQFVCVCSSLYLNCLQKTEKDKLGIEFIMLSPFSLLISSQLFRIVSQKGYCFISARFCAFDSYSKLLSRDQVYIVLPSILEKGTQFNYMTSSGLI